MQAVWELAPQHPDIARVYLFGSVTQPGRFHERSDIDVAVDADTLNSERPFWQALEQTLRRDVDLRALTPPIMRAIDYSGALVYERKTDLSREQYPRGVEGNR